YGRADTIGGHAQRTNTPLPHVLDAALERTHRRQSGHDRHVKHRLQQPRHRDSRLRTATAAATREGKHSSAIADVDASRLRAATVTVVERSTVRSSTIGGTMHASTMVDVAGRRRSPAAVPGYHAGRPPRNKGLRYPADPPRVEEIIAVMRHAGPGVHGDRTRGLMAVLWRSGLRIAEALDLRESDLDERRGALLVRHGKGGERREVGMDEWGWEQLRPWISQRQQMPIGRLFCVIEGPTCGRPWAPGAVRTHLRRLA